MEKDIKVFLKHILDSIEKIENYTENISEGKFLKSIQIQDAVMRRLEIIGEAVRNMPWDFRSKYPDVPWRKIAGLRDVLIHEYFGVDLKLTFKIVKKELPKLKEEVLRILKEIK